MKHLASAKNGAEPSRAEPSLNKTLNWLFCPSAVVILCDIMRLQLRIQSFLWITILRGKGRESRKTDLQWPLRRSSKRAAVASVGRRTRFCAWSSGPATRRRNNCRPTE